MVHEAYEEKQVIEPEVIENLPSVRKLAEIYAKDKSPVDVQLNKPKVIICCKVAVIFQQPSRETFVTDIE